MIPYGHQTIDNKDIEAVKKTLQSDWLTQGPAIKDFEIKLAKICGAKYAVVVSSGTAALHLAYLVAGIEQGDEVITTPNTFVATSNMLLVVGAKPVFCDVRLDNYNIDEKKIEQLITPKTKAIVPVHFAGASCEMSEILKIAKKHKLVVIEDACHALGAEYKNKKIGSLNSDMTIFSFHPVKAITTGEGGAIVTNNKNYYERLISLRSHGVHKNNEGKNVMTEIGYNYRITDIQASLGVSQLDKLDKFIKMRKAVVKNYEQALFGVNEIILPKEIPGNSSAWHIFVILIKDQKRRDELSTYLKQNGVGVNFHYPAVYSHPYYRENGYKDIFLQNEEKYYNSCITLPCYPGLSKGDIGYIGKVIKSFFNKK